MLYRTVKKNNNSISSLGYGCMRFPTNAGIIDYNKTERQINMAIEKGVNYFDTAYPYHGGNSETVLGRILSNGLRNKVFIATKLPPWSVETREDMDRILDEQLKKLKTDYIDYYLVHGIHERKMWDKMLNLEVLDFLNRAKEKGKIRYTGFSHHAGPEDFKDIVDAYDWEMCQIQYSLLDEHNQAGTIGLKYAASKGLAVIVMEPLRGGKLTGKQPKEIQELWNKTSIKRSPAEWALRWVWNHPEVTSVLSGMNNDKHIYENIATASNAQPLSLSKEEEKILEDIRDTYQKIMKVPCSGCNYCMPCPVGVNIPICFELYNDKHLFNTLIARGEYAMRMGVLHSSRASLCVGCGKCEKACPQHIEIRKELMKVSSEMEGMMFGFFKGVSKLIFKA